MTRAERLAEDQGDGQQKEHADGRSDKAVERGKEMVHLSAGTDRDGRHEIRDRPRGAGEKSCVRPWLSGSFLLPFRLIESSPRSIRHPAVISGSGVSLVQNIRIIYHYDSGSGGLLPLARKRRDRAELR